MYEVYIYIYVYVYVYVCIFIYLSMYLFMYSSIYLSIYVDVSKPPVKQEEAIIMNMKIFVPYESCLWVMSWKLVHKQTRIRIEIA